MPPVVDVNTLKKLMAEKLPQREMAKRLNVPRTTLQRMIKGLNKAPAAEGVGAAPSNGVPVVDMSTLTPAEVEAVRGDFWELIGWWRERKQQQVYQSQPRETARQTYHVEKRYITLIHREAAAEGVSITEVVNRAFRAYFEKT
jgi:DNA-binding Lrp family transcriptional regulator